MVNEPLMTRSLLATAIRTAPRKQDFVAVGEIAISSLGRPAKYGGTAKASGGRACYRALSA